MYSKSFLWIFLMSLINFVILDKTSKGASEPQQKKLKKKSIFSPENSSESDSGIVTKAAVIKAASNPVRAQKSQSQQPKSKTRSSVTARSRKFFCTNSKTCHANNFLFQKPNL